jgi:hypothetical protein
MEDVNPQIIEPSIQPSKNSNKKWFLIIGGILFLICICISICVALGGIGAFQVGQEKEPIEDVLNSFMFAMVEKDLDTAFTLFSTRAQRQMSENDLEVLIEGNNYVLFEGYQSIEIQNLSISKSLQTNQDLPQGNVATISGIVYYEDGFTGKFSATLEKENGITWRLHRIDIVVSPDKFSP